MFAGAAFTDEADIKAEDAVNMLASLGVITGYNDGSYQPDKVVTRAEMAKMIFVVRNNSIDDSAYANNSSKLTDISNHWAKGYIKFCESQGIIAGKGNNQFDPDASVTGVEAAKMLLVLTGYDTDKAGLTGLNWRTNTLKYAGAAGILDDVNSPLESGLPRQYAAQMIYNTLDTNRVKWSKDSDSFDDILNGGVKETVGHAYMGLCSDYGYLTEINNDSLTITLDPTYSADNYHTTYNDVDDERNEVSFSKVKEDYSALLGQTVKVMFKDGKTNNVLGVYAVSDNTTYTTFMNQTELSDKDTKIKFDGKSYSVDNTKSIKLIVDGASKDPVDISYFKDTAANKVSMNKVTFIDTNKNNKIDTAIVTTYTKAEVTYVGADQITAGGTTYKFDDENIDETLERDDWAVISENLYDDCKDIVKAEVLNTQLTGYKAKTDYYQYQLDGKWYNSEEQSDKVSTGDTVKAYVYNGVLLDIDSEDGDGSYPSNVAVVVGLGGSDNSLYGDQAKIRYFTGDVKTVTIDDDGLQSDELALGRAYKVSAAGSDTKFENLTVGNKYNGYKFGGNNNKTDVDADQIYATIDGNNKAVKVDDSAVIILYAANGSSKQITGKQYNALKGSDVISGNYSAVFTKETNGLTRVRMASVKVPSTSVSGKSNDNYAYIISDGVENANNKTAISIWTGSENKDVVVDTGYVKGEYVKGMLIGYSDIDADGIINDVDVIGDIKGATDFPTSGVDTNTLYRGSNAANVSNFIAVNDGKLNVTADTTVLVVDSDASSSSNIGIAYTYGDKLPKASKNGSDYLINAMWVMDEAGTDDADIEVLVIDSTGAFKGFKVDDGTGKASVTAEVEGTATYGSVATLTVKPTYKNFEATKTELSVSKDNDLTVKDNTVVTTANTPAGDYTVTVKGTDADGKTVSTTVTFTVAAKEIAAPTALKVTDPTAGDLVAELKKAVSADDENAANVVVSNVKVSLGDTELSDNNQLVTGKTYTVTAVVSPAENYVFDNGKTSVTLTAEVKVQ